MALRRSIDVLNGIMHRMHETVVLHSAMDAPGAAPALAERGLIRGAEKKQGRGHGKPPRGSGIIAVSDEGMVVVCHTGNGKASFPKGGLDPGESVCHGALREWQEETGLPLEPLSFTGAWVDEGFTGVRYLLARCAQCIPVLRPHDRRDTLPHATHPGLQVDRGVRGEASATTRGDRPCLTSTIPVIRNCRCRTQAIQIRSLRWDGSVCKLSWAVEVGMV